MHHAPFKDQAGARGDPRSLHRQCPAPPREVGALLHVLSAAIV